jgi:4-amino-4-deoxy-L-arabinose transferase-like glycosyltransferase
MAALAGITALAAGLRFGLLGEQGFWYDESYSSFLVRLPIKVMFTTLGHTESTPPLYYALAFVWSHVFSPGEVGLRSLSAFLGTATVPVAYILGRELSSPRVGLMAAGFTASSPLLVWYSQEARAYALLVFLGALGLLAFLRALEQPVGTRLAAWSAVSALALTAHYFALVLVLPQAVWLLVRGWRRATTWLSLAAVIATGVGLIPLISEQLGPPTHTEWIARIPLGLRLRQVVTQYVAGFGAPRALLTVAALGAAVGVVLLARACARERRAAGVLALLALSGLTTALLLGALGHDELITRNLIGDWLPLALLVALGLGARRAGGVGLVVALALILAWVGVDLAVATESGLQRPDWRRVNRALGRPSGGRLIVLDGYRPKIPLLLYRPDMKRVHRNPVFDVAEVDVVVPRVPRGRSCWWGAACNLRNAPLRLAPPPGFSVQRVQRIPNFRLVTLSADHPRRIRPGAVRRKLDYPRDSAVMFEPRFTRLTGRVHAP